MTAELELRLRLRLAGTSEAAPRPLVDLELPLRAEKLINAAMLRSLRPASVLVPVLRRPAGLQVLLTRRSENLRSHKGQISFPGGHREETDHSAAAAALREAEEEVGIPPAEVEVIGYLDDYPTLTGFLVTPVIGLVSNLPSIRPCAREVAEVFEMPLEIAIRRSSFERKFLTQGGMNVPFFELIHGPHRIWGATAGMLWDLARKVGDGDD